MSDRAIPFSSSNAIQNNVIYQKFTEKINSPVTADIVFAITDIDDENIPNDINYKKLNLKLKTKNYRYPNFVESCVIEVRAFYEQDIDFDFNLDFSDIELNYGSESNYFKYYPLNSVSSQIELSSIPDWKIYVNDKTDNFISFSNILSQIISKGGYYIDYVNKEFKKFNINNHSDGNNIGKNELLDSTTINFKEDKSDLKEQVYVISKASEQEITQDKQNEFEEYTITENPDDAEIPPETVKILDTIDQNFDASGQTKEKKEITYINKTPIEEKYWRYGFAFEAKDALKEFCYYVPSVEKTQCAFFLHGEPERFWRVVEYRHTKYDYNDNKYNYLIGIDTNGWKLGRFRVESKYNDQSATGWQTKNLRNQYLKNLYKFKKFRLQEITRNIYFPHAVYYKYEDVAGRQVEDIFHIVKEYNKDKQEIETKYERKEGWFEPMFLGGTYHYSSCFGVSYDGYRDKDGNIKIKDKQIVQPDIFGQIKEYRTDISIYTNKQDIRSIGLGLKPNYKVIDSDQEPYYIETTKIFQTQNENYKELAEKTEFSRSSGIPPIGDRLQKIDYEYGDSDDRIEIPDLSNEKIVKYKIYSDSSNGDITKEDEENASNIRPNNYDFKNAKNFEYLQQQSSSTIKLKDSNYNLEDIIKPNFITDDKFIIDEISKILDTRDKFSSGLFVNGEMRTHEYTEIGIKPYKQVYSVNKVTEDEKDDDVLQFPPLFTSGIGDDRQTILNEMSKYQQRGNIDDENKPRQVVQGNNGG